MLLKDKLFTENTIYRSTEEFFPFTYTYNNMISRVIEYELGNLVERTRQQARGRVAANKYNVSFGTTRPLNH